MEEANYTQKDGWGPDRAYKEDMYVTVRHQLCWNFIKFIITYYYYKLDLLDAWIA
jgi:hypothetical protein